MKKQKLISKALIGIATVVFSCTAAQAQTQTLIATKDAQLTGIGGMGTSNDGTTDILTASKTGNIVNRGIVEFDINPCDYPDGIQSAHLELYTHGGVAGGGAHFGTSPDTDFKIELNSSSWQENTVTWNNQPGVIFSPVVNVQGPNTAFQDYVGNAIDVTALVDHILSTGDNFGFKISLQDETVTSNVQVEFSSSDDQTMGTSLHPKLTIVPVPVGNFPFLPSSPLNLCYGMAPVQLLPTAPQGTYAVTTTGADGLVSTVSGGMETWTFDPSLATNMVQEIKACIPGGCCYTMEINTGEPWPKTTNNSSVYDQSVAVETDELGGVYSAGNFNNYTEFSSLIGVNSTSITQDVNAYIAKYDNCNDIEWVVPINSNDRVQITGMAILQAVQKVYVIGNYTHGITLNSAIGVNGPVIPQNSSTDLGSGVFIAAYDYSGVLLHQTYQSGPNYLNSNAVITASRYEFPTNVFNDRVFIGVDQASGTAIDIAGFNSSLGNLGGDTYISPVAIEVKDIVSDAGRMFVTGNFQDQLTTLGGFPLLSTNSTLQDAFIMGFDVTPAIPTMVYKQAFVGLTGPSTASADASGIDGVRNHMYYTGTYRGGTVFPFGGSSSLPAPTSVNTHAYVGAITGISNSWVTYIDGHLTGTEGLDVDVDRVTESPYFTGLWYGDEFHIASTPVTPIIGSGQGTHVYVVEFSQSGAPSWTNHSISPGVIVSRIAHENNFLYASGGYIGAMTMWNEVLPPGSPLNSPIVSTPNAVNSFVWRFSTAGNYAGSAYRLKSPGADEENEPLSDVDVYPNPTNGEFKIQVAEAQSDFISLRVVNLAGQEIFNDLLQLNARNEVDLDLGDYPAGIYMVTAIVNSEVISKKVIKQ